MIVILDNEVENIFGKFINDLKTGSTVLMLEGSLSEGSQQARERSLRKYHKIQ